MSNKRSGTTIITSALFCLLINVLDHRALIFGILNSLILAISLSFFYDIFHTSRGGFFSGNPWGFFRDSYKSKEEFFKGPFLFIFFLAFIPLFSFVPDQPVLYLYLFFGLLCLLVALKIKRLKYIFVTLGLLSIFWGSLISNGVLTGPLNLNHERLIWNNPESNRLIGEHQRDAVFVLYRMRPFLFNKGVYIYKFFTKIAWIFTLRNINDTLLVANLYPLVWGIAKSFKDRKNLINSFSYLAILLVLITAGINNSPDKFNSLFLAAPFFTYLILRGLLYVDRKIYLALIILSLILVNSPIK